MNMEPEKKIRMLQMFYAGVLADSALRFTSEGIFEQVAAQKNRSSLPPAR